LPLIARSHGQLGCVIPRITVMGRDIIS
jgi:hypothetical protein